MRGKKMATNKQDIPVDNDLDAILRSESDSEEIKDSKASEPKAEKGKEPAKESQAKTEQAKAKVEPAPQQGNVQTALKMELQLSSTAKAINFSEKKNRSQFIQAATEDLKKLGWSEEIIQLFFKHAELLDILGDLTHYSRTETARRNNQPTYHSQMFIEACRTFALIDDLVETQKLAMPNWMGRSGNTLLLLTANPVAFMKVVENLKITFKKSDHCEVNEVFSGQFALCAFLVNRKSYNEVINDFNQNTKIMPDLGLIFKIFITAILFGKALIVKALFNIWKIGRGDLKELFVNFYNGAKIYQGEQMIAPGHFCILEKDGQLSVEFCKLSQQHAHVWKNLTFPTNILECAAVSLNLEVLKLLVENLPSDLSLHARNLRQYIALLKMVYTDGNQERIDRIDHVLGASGTLQQLLGAAQKFGDLEGFEQYIKQIEEPCNYAKAKITEGTAFLNILHPANLSDFRPLHDLEELREYCEQRRQHTASTGQKDVTASISSTSSSSSSTK